MLKDKKDEPDKKIPPKFGNFVKTNEYKELLESMLDYCRVSQTILKSITLIGTISVRK